MYFIITEVSRTSNACLTFYPVLIFLPHSRKHLSYALYAHIICSLRMLFLQNTITNDFSASSYNPREGPEVSVVYRGASTCLYILINRLPYIINKF